MIALTDLAREMGVDTRTMRRAAADGTIRCERVSPRRQSVSQNEYRYAVGHWPLLAKLRQMLRTEPNVRLAVLYGSTARGTETPSSDIDVLVALAEDRPETAVKLATRLERGLGGAVDVARLNRVRGRSPLLLLQVIDEGRVVLNRDGLWEQLRTQRAEIEQQASREHEALRRRARTSVEELLATS
ncbi:MAG: nucleotidyltransferase domain-containing protein [Solirubrobacteraceae bacterium]